MKIVWSKNAKKHFQNRWRYQSRIKVRLAEMDDRSAPGPISKKYRRQKIITGCVGDYRIITLRDDPDNLLCFGRQTQNINDLPS
jgi:mRNA-degrading endonuclease RelE of RelBE toxin-antitoxin system